ncbi:MAG: SRPBCC family protein [Actinomycetota bacterium]|nr:SRPBCC family protein [Actinomycetota bacterium]
MPESETFIDASPDHVFDVLLDVTTYPEWVVGCRQIRACDPSWPAPGARFEHRVGVGPLTVDDSTGIVSVEPPHRLVLEARAGPAGTAEVVLEVSPEGEGSRVTISEQAVRGPAALLRSTAQDDLLEFRNDETLDRLRACVERRQAR